MPCGANIIRKLTLIGQYQTTKTPRSPRQIKDQRANFCVPVFFVPRWFIFYHIEANWPAARQTMPRVRERFNGRPSYFS
jgi:hypothetical protein